MMNETLEVKVRRRLYLSISPTTAAVAGCRQEDIQQFIAHQVVFSEVQLVALARYLGVK